MDNIFDTMYKDKTASDLIQIAQCIGNKIFKPLDDYSCECHETFVSTDESIKKQFPLDSLNVKFYQYYIDNINGIKNTHIYLAVVYLEDSSKESCLHDLSHILSKSNQYLFVASIRHSKDTILDSSKVLLSLYKMILSKLGNGNISTCEIASVHTLINYLYRAFDIDIVKNNNIDFASLGITTSPQKVYPFIIDDVKYCNTLFDDNLDFAKAINSDFRFFHYYKRV